MSQNSKNIGAGVQGLPKFGIAAPVRRLEDHALITGQGCYVADITPSGALQGFVLRSIVAHARFTLSGLEDALAMPGVKLILTARDVADLKPIPCYAQLPQADSSEINVPPYEVLCSGMVRHVGDAIAFIVADSIDAARDAAERIDVDYDMLDAVVETGSALDAGAALVWPEHGSNKALEYGVGDLKPVQAAIATAAKVARLEIINNRVVANYLETRGVVACHDAATDTYSVIVGSQGVHLLQEALCEILEISKGQLKVQTPDVGGGFGTKAFPYREYPLAMVAAKRLGRPVKWVGDRTEHFLGCAHGRDHVSSAELAMDEKGKFLALKVDITANLGAYLSQYGAYVPNNALAMATGVYDIPLLHVRVRGTYTNTSPVDAYRGAGRPEGAYLIERLADEAARVAGLAPDEIRRRNFIAPEKFPFTTLTGRVYDSGEYEAHMRAAMAKAGWADFEKRRASSRKNGKCRGIGLSVHVDCCSAGAGEPATIRLDADGGFSIFIGTQDSGQGHATAYAQIAAIHLGADPSVFRIVQGDTQLVAQGGGTGGSRSIPLGCVSVERASAELAVRIKSHASDVLETTSSDLEILSDGVRVVGTDRIVGFPELVRDVTDPDKFTGEGEFTPESWTSPNGTHVCEVEVDPETGGVSLLGYTIVDDFGAVLNPLLLESQVHGGVVQGIGQALLERTVYDQDGQLLTATFMDYAMPRASDVPWMDFTTRNVPSPFNVFGLKGAGESGSVASCPAVMNAIVDALDASHGVRHVDMPATPESVWKAITVARSNWS